MKNVLRILNGFEKAFVTISMVVMVILIFLQVFTRYVMGDAMSWTEEASRYIFIWLIFLSVGIAFVEKKHIAIDIIMDRLPKTAQRVLQQFVYILLMGVSVFLLVQGLSLVEQMQTFNQKSANLQLPMWIVYAALPVGFFFAILRLVQASIHLYSDDEPVHKEGPII